MASDLLSTRITFEGGSVEYVSQGEVVFFDFDTWGKTQATTHNMRRVDALVIPAAEPPPFIWLVEVKDFRILNHPPAKRNTTDLPQTLTNKLNDTLTILSDAATRPMGLPMQEEMFFLFHYEMPSRPLRSSYFPSGYPLDQFDFFRSHFRHPRVTRSFMMNAEQINASPVTPWEVRLYATRGAVGE